MALSLPNLAAQYQSAEVYKGVSDFKSLCELARSKAVLKKQAHEVRVKSSTRRLEVVESGETESRGSGIAALDQLFEKNTGARAQHVSTALARRDYSERIRYEREGADNADGFKVTFYSDGTAEACRVRILGPEGRRSVLVVDGFSGHAKPAPERAAP